MNRGSSWGIPNRITGRELKEREMTTGPLHITSGDIAGDNLRKAGLPGEVFVWHDILYDGPRQPGWPDEEVLKARALFIEETTGGGLNRSSVLDTLHAQYRLLAEMDVDRQIVLWFDACLFDQAMLVHILSCLVRTEARRVELLCVDAFPGIAPYNGLGQLNPQQLASLYSNRSAVTEEQYRFAALADRAFAAKDVSLFGQLSQAADVPLPWIPAAVRRWLQEQPDPATGLGRLESLALAAVRSGCHRPWKIFEAVAAADTPPQYWGDITLWAVLNGLAERTPSPIRIEGPSHRLPQWQSPFLLKEFRISPLPTSSSESSRTS